eukprot:s1378_g2.t4
MCARVAEALERSKRKQREIWAKKWRQSVCFPRAFDPYCSRVVGWILSLGLILAGASCFTQSYSVCAKELPELYSFVQAYIVFMVVTWLIFLLLPVLPYLLASTGVNLPRCADSALVESMDSVIFDVELFCEDADASEGVLPIECCVCCERFGHEKTIKRTPCKHVFHQDCLSRWLSVTDSCPVCRKELRKVDSPEDPEAGEVECLPTIHSHGHDSAQEEVQRLRRANHALEDELRKLQVPPSRKEGFLAEQGREFTRQAFERINIGQAEPGRTAGAPSWRDATELREDLQQQLQEIRQEVTRCARALQEPAAIPAEEVLDIRQQLEALGEEVQQTSRVVASRDLRELDEVRHQLEAIQRQVSNTLSAAWSRPTEAPPARPSWPSSQPELNELRAEVNSLRAQLGQLSTKDRTVPGWKRHLGQRRFEPTLGSLAPEVAALHGRLTAIRTEVARVLQESQNCEEADPALQAQLRVLLQELSNVRSDAATVAAGGSPGHWTSWRTEPMASFPVKDAAQVEAREAMTGAPSLFVCPHLTGDVTFGQTAVLNGGGLSRPSSASSRDGRLKAAKRLLPVATMAAIMDLLINDSEDEAQVAAPCIWPKAPALQEWAEILLAEESPASPRPAPRGQAGIRDFKLWNAIWLCIRTGRNHAYGMRIEQSSPDLADDSLFHLDGKDKSWFLQKGGVSFNRPSAERFRLDVTFCGSRFGDDYAELSRLEQANTTNWLIAIGVVFGDNELTGYEDLLSEEKHSFFGDNSADGQFEIDAFEGQTLSVEFINHELWITEGAERKALGIWANQKLPAGDFFPAVLTSNCPSLFSAKVGFQNSQPLQPPLPPSDRGPQHLPRRPSRSKLGEAEPSTRRF